LHNSYMTDCVRDQRYKLRVNLYNNNNQAFYSQAS
jgi:hypothetical protein